MSPGPVSMPDTESTPAVREGDLLAGKYRVERVLGEGGMGIVVAAVHEQLRQRVAIKFVRKEALSHPEAIERFLREARAAAALRSEHVAKVSDVGTLENGAPYMVMEFLEGRDLSAVLAERRTVALGVAAEWVIQACEAVAEAHAKGIVHRDLKPGNLFLARTVGGNSAIKVLDFGVSKSVAGELTSTSAMLGSPFYMAPEQMRSSKDVTPRSDVWALGVVLFQLLAGKMPFEAESLPELCFKVAQDPPASLRDLVPGMPSEIYDIVDRCLQKRPDDRFQDASELATALEPFAPPAASIVAERARMVTGVNMRLRGPTVMERPATAQTWRSADMPEASASGARAAMTPAAWDSKQRERQGPSKTRVSWVARGVGALAAIGVATLGLVLWHARSTGTGGTGDNTGGASTSRATETQGRDPAPAAPASTAGAAPVVALTPVPAAAASVALPEHPAADHAEASSPASGAAVVAPSGSASAASLGPGASSRRADAKPSTAGRPPRPAQDDIPTMR